MSQKLDEVYRERNRAVAALAWLAWDYGYRVGTARTAIEGWDPEWHGCVYIDLPAGQVSWHYHDSEAHLFAGLPDWDRGWDGHDTPEKYRRVEAFVRLFQHHEALLKPDDGSGAEDATYESARA